jgi:hypothetical protein
MANEIMTAGQKAAADLSALLRARNPIIIIVSNEEQRAERGGMEACQSAGYLFRAWDAAQGITGMTGERIEEAREPGQALAYIRDNTDRAVYFMRDLTDPAWMDPVVRRTLRNLARSLPTTPRDEARSIVIVTARAEVPADLRDDVIVLEWPLPDRAEIAAVLDARIETLPETDSEGRAVRAQAAPNGTRDAAIDAAMGLSEKEASACYAKSLVTTRRIDPATVSGEKKRVISRERVIEWFEPLAGGLDAVGGYANLKAWLIARKAAFSAKARAYGLPAPKGALLVGVPGCGKSLTAKAIATAYGMPLLRLDLGSLKGKYVGESEGNLRRALKTAESVAPCVVWVDEIEKALAGASQGAADGGVSADALGTILSWMQDRQGSVFVVATANDVSGLPPELLRKGRFDEMFFVDLPTAEERGAVIAAALRQHGRDVKSIDLGAVAGATVDFTGAEIAALVPEAMFTAFADGERAITTADLVSAARGTVPLSKTASEKIAKLREWAKGRARNASATETVKSAAKVAALDL